MSDSAAVLAASPAAASGRPHVETPVAYDGILLAGFGGPEGQDDVIPFLRNVTRGRGIPDERLEEVAHHYRHFGGVSPINAQNRALKAAIEAELAARGIDLPVYWGNRNWAPYLEEAVQDAAADGRTTLLAIATSAYSSYSSCRQYREDSRPRARRDRPRRHGHDRQGAPVLRPPRLRPRVHRGRDRGGARADRRRRARRRHPGALLHPQHPDLRRAAIGTPRPRLRRGRRVRGAARGGRRRRDGEGRRGGPRGRRSRVGARLPVPLRARDAAVARTRRLRRDRRAACARASRRSSSCRSDSSATTWKCCGTSTPRRWMPHRPPASGPCAHRRPGIDPAFVSGLVDLVVERRDGTPAQERPHLTPLGPWFDVCRPACCENVRAGFKPAVVGGGAMTALFKPGAPIRVGTRASALAVAQTSATAAQLGALRARHDHVGGRSLYRAARFDGWHRRLRLGAARRAPRRRGRPHRALVQGPPDRPGRRHPARGRADARGRARRPRHPRRRDARASSRRCPRRDRVAAAAGAAAGGTAGSRGRRHPRQCRHPPRPALRPRRRPPRRRARARGGRAGAARAARRGFRAAAAGDVADRARAGRARAGDPRGCLCSAVGAGRRRSTTPRRAWRRLPSAGCSRGSRRAAPRPSPRTRPSSTER